MRGVDGVSPLLLAHRFLEALGPCTPELLFHAPHLGEGEAQAGVFRVDGECELEELRGFHEPLAVREAPR